MVFDMPAAAGGFSARLRQMENALAQVKNPRIKLLEQWTAASTVALQQRFQEIVQGGGEGVMLRHKKRALSRRAQ